MTIIKEGTQALIKGTPVILFEAVGAQFAGLLGGKIDLDSLGDAADKIYIYLETKYTVGGAYLPAEDNIGKKVDRIFRLTPTEEYYGYKITIELTGDSVSATADLPYIITRSILT